MNNIELYINAKLCDIGNPQSLGIRLNRVLLKPSELNTKDAQFSYSIAIPSSPTNDEIFGYSNVEEVKDKFNYEYKTSLYVDGILVFDGYFKLNEIDSDGNYKGNLFVPAIKTIKELFGDKKMNELDTSWEVKFPTLVTSLNDYNTRKNIPDCFFPFALYGLLPKVPKDLKETTYSEKDVWDDTVRLGLEDFPPSINCMKTIRKIFESLKDEKGESSYTISGTAFNDPRLLNLYMSYSNPTEYEQEWNWGDLGKMYIAGNWTNYEERNGKKYIEERAFEVDINRKMYTANLLDSTMTSITHLIDRGTNILHSSVVDKKTGGKKSNTIIRIPKSGFYKISLDVNMKLHKGVDVGNGAEYSDSHHPFRIISGYFKEANNNIYNRAHEVKIIRDFGTGYFGVENESLNGDYYTTNLPQNNKFEEHNDSSDRNLVTNEQDFPKYFPVPGKKCVQFVDPSVNEKLVSGFRWGCFKDSDDRFPLDQYRKVVPKINEIDTLGRILAIRSAWSWDVKFSQKEKIYSVINNKHNLPTVNKDGDLTGETDVTGYWVYGFPEKKDEIQDDEDDTKRQKFCCYPSTKFMQELEGSKSTFGLIDEDNNVNTFDYAGSGRLHQVIWLNKGEQLTLVTVSDAGVIRRHRKTQGRYGWIRQDIDFKLEIVPFRKNLEWSKVDNFNKSADEMKWNDETNFQKDHINLVKFLPSDKKVDEWLDHFCKAFNLQLEQKDSKTFELNLKQKPTRINPDSVFDLDQKTGLNKRSNQPLGLPSVFDIGFKINEEEEGYVKNNKDRGGEKIVTGSVEKSEISQLSDFSYNWFKKITYQSKKTPKEKIVMSLPVISHKEIWAKDAMDYAEMVKKLYTNYSQRFWYKDADKVYSLDPLWKIENVKTEPDKEQQMIIPVLTNALEGNDKLVLNYKDAEDSIFRTYFKIIATNDSNYTDVECFLSPDEYEQLDGTKLIKYNGDLYYIAAIEGYDPLGVNKTKLKLIRKI